MQNIESLIESNADKETVRVPFMVPRFVNQPSPVTDEIDPKTMIFVRSGTKMYRNDQTGLFRELKKMSERGLISRSERKEATKFIKHQNYVVKNPEYPLYDVKKILEILKIKINHSPQQTSHIPTLDSPRSPGKCAVSFG